MMLLTSVAMAQTWTTVVNNNTLIPGSTKTFNSYNQPSVNGSGLVVFRARSKGGNGGEPIHGIYTRRMSVGNQPIVMLFDRDSQVPQPNNTGSTFLEFPSIPRIDFSANTIATRGQSQPVWTYQLPDGTDTKVGTSGIYVLTSKGERMSGQTQLGAVPGFSHFQVPGEADVTKFDQFPGAPAVAGSMVVFKGNFTRTSGGKTGVYYRDFAANQGAAPVQLIADTDTLIPNQPAGGSVTFGSTAPPSAAMKYVVFAGYDNEDNPNLGGLYRAALVPNPKLDVIVGIGAQVPGETTGVKFKGFGEALSYDGRYISFWGYWGSTSFTRVLYCPTDGNKDLIDYCNEQYPNGHAVQVPVHQGIFVVDTVSRKITQLANSPGRFHDFVYWVFSGKPPGTGGDEEGGEPARWRSSSFTAVSSMSGAPFFEVVFKGSTGVADGIYAARGPVSAPIVTLLDTSMPGQVIDPAAPAGSLITSVGIEREAFRGQWLVVTAGMMNESTQESMAGIYVTRGPLVK